MNETLRLTAGQALVRYRQAQYSERDGERRRVIPAMFGIFGHGNVCGLGEALVSGAEELPFLAPKHEQSMVHTALGYAKATRRLATLACTASIGPGATNLITGAATATTNRLPVLLLPADTYATRRQGPVLQQLEHPAYRDWSVNECLRPVSRFFDRIARPEQLLEALPEAIRILLDPASTGAVTLALHQDVQGEAFEFPLAFFEPRTWSVARRPPEERAIAAAARLLGAAERPLIVAGGGVWHSGAEGELRRLAEGTGAPVAETSAGKGTYLGELALGGLGVNGTRAANDIARAADVVLCAGTRLSDFTTASHSLFQDEGVRFIGVNVDEADAHKLGALPVVADAREALAALSDALQGRRAPQAHRETARTALTAWRRELDVDLAERSGEPVSQGEVLRTLNHHARAGDWVLAAAGGSPGDLLKLWEPIEGGRVHIEFAFSCMGHELPAGLGIRMADPASGEIYVVIGDGTYRMAAGELATAVQERLKVTVVLLVNGGYQSIHALQRSTVGATLGTEFTGLDVDYVANARSFGWHARAAATIDELTEALAEARGTVEPALIAVTVAPDRGLLGAEAFWDLGVAEESSLAAARAAATAQADGRASQRFYAWRTP
jgi:3D-(3,5/4)-trihydroxycyclohexane-1,2-dione acylhydrolase (decyclizing)